MKILRLFLIFFLICGNTLLQAQNSAETYQIQHIPFQLYPLTSQTSPLSQDDKYSDELDIGFDFNFFANTYDKVIFADNGVVSFDLNKANSYCSWQIQDTIPNPNFTEKNAIFGVYQDININLGMGGSVYYELIGTAPFRRFVTFYDDVRTYNCNTTGMTTQIILYETYNFIDVQIGERTACYAWNNGNGLLGILNETGDTAYVPPGRNTGDWSATEEGWRFRPEVSFPDYQYILCDANLDGVETFDLGQIINHYTGYASVTLHPTYQDAAYNINSMSGMYNNTSNAESLYIRLDDGQNIEIRRVILAAIDCSADYDFDGISTNTEDINGNGNYGDDDSDSDGIPDFVDDDDDGDMVLTQFEPMNIDTDSDGTPNYLDIDDDGDGIFTIYEDVALPHTYPQDYNPRNNDTDGDGIPNYLDIDDDGDGILTINEQPDPNNNGIPDDAVDTDGDGIPDYLDSINPYNDHDNDGITDENDLDDDNDGIPDIVECNGIDPLTDADNDGVPVYLDDDDNDNSVGNANYAVETAFDLDGDGIPNHFDLDSDGDGLFDLVEAGSTGWTDANMDGMIEGNVGNNGLVDILESSPDSGIINYTYQDTDNDGTPDFLDIDDDNDGILTINEHPDDNANHYPDDAWDSDNDSIPDYLDNTTTGSIRLLPDNAINVYPNPAINILHIDVNININKAGLILFTQDGKLIRQQNLNNTKNIISLPQTQGIYYLKITTDKGEIFKPVIKK